MLFTRIQILTLALLFSNPLQAGPAETYSSLVDIYTSTAQKLHETYRGKSCEDLNQKSNATSESEPCLKCQSSEKKVASDANELAEKSFFHYAADQEVKNLSCSLQRVELAQKNPELKQRIKENVLSKLPSLSENYKKLRTADFEYFQQRDRVNALRPSGLNANGMTAEYEKALQILQEKDKVRTQLASAMNSTFSSVWMGNTEAARKFLNEFYKSGFSNSPKEIQEFEKKFESFFSNIQSELNSNRSQLADEINGESKIKSSDSLSLGTRRMLVQNRYYTDSYFGMNPQSQAALQCRLDGKYGQGLEYLNNTAFAGSLLLSGGASLIARTPLIFRGTMITAEQSGVLAHQTAKVLLYGSALTTGVSTLAEIDRQCPWMNPKGLAQGNLCQLKADEWVQTELMQLDNADCALSVLLSGAPSVVTGYAWKKVQSLQKARQYQEALKAQRVETEFKTTAEMRTKPLSPEWQKYSADFQKSTKAHIEANPQAYIKAIERNDSHIQYLKEMGYEFKIKDGKLEASVPSFNQVIARTENKIKALVDSGKLRPNEVLVPARVFRKKMGDKEDVIFLRYGEDIPKGYSPYDGLLKDGLFERAIAEGKFPIGESHSRIAGGNSSLEHDLSHISGFIQNPEYMAAYRNAYEEVVRNGKYTNFNQQQRFFVMSETFEFMPPVKATEFRQYMKERNLEIPNQGQEFITVKQVEKSLEKKTLSEMQSMLTELHQKGFSEPLGGAGRDILTRTYEKKKSGPNAFMENGSGLVERALERGVHEYSEKGLKDVRRHLSESLTALHNSQFLDPATAFKESTQKHLQKTDRTYKYYCESGFTQMPASYQIFCKKPNLIQIPDPIPLAKPQARKN